MIFHVIDPSGEAADKSAARNAPAVMLLSPELSGWWAMAALSSKLTDRYRVVIATWDGFGDAADKPFPGIVKEAQEVAAWVESHVPGGLEALVGCGMGGQVAVEALCEDSACARHLMVGDVLCEPVPGNKGSAWLTGMAFGLMGAPKEPVLRPGMTPDQIHAVADKRLPRVKRRRRYLASQLDSMGLPRALAPQFAEAVAVTPRSTAKAMTEAVEAWRIPGDVRAVRCPVLVTGSGISTEPYRKSAEALHRALPGSRLDIARDLSRNELYLRYPQRAAEMLGILLSS